MKHLDHIMSALFLSGAVCFGATGCAATSDDAEIATAQQADLLAGGGVAPGGGGIPGGGGMNVGGGAGGGGMYGGGGGGGGQGQPGQEQFIPPPPLQKNVKSVKQFGKNEQQPSY